MAVRTAAHGASHWPLAISSPAANAPTLPATTNPMPRTARHRGTGARGPSRSR